MKLLIIALISIVAILPNCIARAGGKHHHETVINNHSTSIYDVKGVAAAMANGMHQFDVNGKKFQWSIAGATYNSESGISAAIGHRINNHGLFLNVSVSHEEDETGAAVGLRGNF